MNSPNIVSAEVGAPEARSPGRLDKLAADFKWDLPYALRRMPTFARNVVTTTQPLAAQAGLRMLEQGGNAVDAALATAITLTIVEPVSCGFGSDGFAVVWDGTRLHGLNASGRSPAATDAKRLCGMAAMPEFGWDSVTVPGVVSGWVALSERFGRLPFPRLFESAIEYARNGFLLTPTIARQWAGLKSLYRSFPDAFNFFFPHGESPAPGTIIRFPEHAETLEAIAASSGEDFYRGSLAKRIARYSRESGGSISLDDLETHSAEWVVPLRIKYRDVELHELPPNGQGLVALIALGVLDHFDMSSIPVDSAESIHLQIEATRLGFADVYQHVSDPASMTVDPERFLDPQYLKRRASDISFAHAQFPESGLPIDGGTNYIASGDSGGMMVSYIQSSGRGFGAGLVVPGTGIALQCRGRSFSLVPNHANRIGPRKRPFHTNIPAVVTRSGRPVACFGLQGWNTQPPVHVQFMNRLVDHKQNPQAVLEAPRWRIAMEEPAIVLEEGFDAAIHEGLQARGHHIVKLEKFQPASTPFGSALCFGAAQLVYRLGDGYIAASEPRRDGQAVGF